MDGDIRDLLADDIDVFDPFDDEEEFDENDTSDFGCENDDGVIGQPLEETAPKQEKPLLSAEERIAALLDQMPSQKRLLLRLIAFCEEKKSGVEMDEYTEELKQNCYSVYTPVVMRELLEEAGAIEYLPRADEDSQQRCASLAENNASERVPESAYADVSESAREDARENTNASVHEQARESAFAANDPEAPLSWNEGGVLMNVDESHIQHEHLTEGGQEVTLDYLEIEPTRPGFWLATPAGLAAVHALDDVETTRELLTKEPEYLDIYHQILDFCAQEEFGRSPKEIDNLVNNSPLLQEPRRYSGYFVSRLERQGALEWRSGWCITAAGTTIMNEYAVTASKKEADHVSGD